MRHKISQRKLSRTSSHRRSLFRNLSTSLIEHERLVTTVEKAKEIRPIVEKLVTMAKSDNLHSKKKAFSYLNDKTLVNKLFSVIAIRYSERPGGYLRITRVGHRSGDCAEMAQIEFV